MRAPLIRFGVAIDAPLLSELDQLVADGGTTRSELLRDLARAEVVRAKVRVGVDAVAALTIVYNHHVRDLSEKLTEIQHGLGDGVRSAMHVHLSHDYCLEVIIIRGRSDQLQIVANQILGMRGVKHGGIEIVSDVELGHGNTPHDNSHSHGHDHPHTHDHDHHHDHRPAPRKVTAATRTGARGPGGRPKRRPARTRTRR
jgi:CopG family nickel-responsive transcriptional regulator